MKFCYADESLDYKGQLVQVVIGIVADAQRLNRSREEFADFFELVKNEYPEACRS